MKFPVNFSTARTQGVGIARASKEKFSKGFVARADAAAAFRENERRDLRVTREALRTRTRARTTSISSRHAVSVLRFARIPPPPPFMRHQEPVNVSHRWNARRLKDAKSCRHAREEESKEEFGCIRSLRKQKKGSPRLIDASLIYLRPGHEVFANSFLYRLPGDKRARFDPFTRR